MAWSNDIPDHPVIANLMRTGYPDGKSPEYPHCPVCGAKEISEAYVQYINGVVGCDECCDMVFPEDINPQHEGFFPDADGWYQCPVCGQRAEMVAIKRDTKEIVGCDNCILRPDAWERSECFHERD